MSIFLGFSILTVFEAEPGSLLTLVLMYGKMNIFQRNDNISSSAAKQQFKVADKGFKMCGIKKVCWSKKKLVCSTYTSFTDRVRIS